MRPARSGRPRSPSMRAKRRASASRCRRACSPVGAARPTRASALASRSASAGQASTSAPSPAKASSGAAGSHSNTQPAPGCRRAARYAKSRAAAGSAPTCSTTARGAGVVSRGKSSGAPPAAVESPASVRSSARASGSACTIQMGFERGGIDDLGADNTAPGLMRANHVPTRRRRAGTGRQRLDLPGNAWFPARGHDRHGRPGEEGAWHPRGTDLPNLGASPPAARAC